MNIKKWKNKKNWIRSYIEVFIVLLIFIASSVLFNLNIFNLNNNIVDDIFGVKSAYATSVEEASGSLAEAQAKLDNVSAEYNSSIESAQNLQIQVQEATDAAYVAQKDLAIKQKELADFVRNNYRNSSSLPFLTVIFAAQSLDEFVKNVYYTNRYVNYVSDAVKEQKEAKENFDKTLEELNSKSQEYNNAVNDANSKLQEANALVDSAKQNLSNAEDAERLAKQAQSIPVPNPPVPTPEEGGDWKSGSASAYGGSTDPGAGSTTATGESITDFSMGVAIPMSWANYSSYFGHSIQIKIGGSVVIAKINDCGGLGGRDLDLQPGVFKSFGYQSCSAWGVRNVEYKIL